MSESEDKREWKPGLPPGALYDGMVDDYEVQHTMGGQTWHRRRTPAEAAAHRERRLTHTT